MRLFLSLLLISIVNLGFADDGDSGFPPPPSNTMNNPTSPYANSSSQSPNGQPSTSSTGSDTFGSMVQQQTTQAMQAFQNVNYQKLSGAENQGGFFSDDSSDNNPPDPSHLFNVFSSGS